LSILPVELGYNLIKNTLKQLIPKSNEYRKIQTTNNHTDTTTSHTEATTL